VSFGDVSLGTRAGPGQSTLNDTDSFYLSNDGVSTVTVDLLTDVTYSGLGAGDYTLVPTPSCSGALTFTPSYQCLMEVYFSPHGLGDRSATMTVKACDGSSTSVGLSGTGSPTASLSFGDTTLGPSPARTPLICRTTAAPRTPSTSRPACPLVARAQTTTS
jgi:hypothetical protein